jgi:hypothetical protein
MLSRALALFRNRCRISNVRSTWPGPDARQNYSVILGQGDPNNQNQGGDGRKVPRVSQTRVHWVVLWVEAHMYPKVFPPDGCKDLVMFL